MVKNPPFNAGDAGLIPGRETKIPHAVGQLSLRAATTEPVCSRACAPQLESPCAETTEPARSGACASQLERNLCAATKSPPGTTKDPHMPQLRPDAAK